MQRVFFIIILSLFVALSSMGDQALAKIKLESIGVSGLYAKGSSFRSYADDTKGPGVTVQVKLSLNQYIRFGGEFSYTRYTIDWGPDPTVDANRAVWEEWAAWWPWSHYPAYLKAYDVLNLRPTQSAEWDIVQGLYHRDWIGFVDISIPTQGKIKPYVTGGVGIYKWIRKAALNTKYVLGYANPVYSGVPEEVHQGRHYADPWHQAYSWGISGGVGVDVYLSDHISLSVFGRYHVLVSTPAGDYAEARHPFENLLNGNAGLSFHY